MGDSLWATITNPGSAGTASALTLGTQFSVASATPLLSIPWYSPSGAAALPTICGIWDVASQSLVTSDADPEWLLEDGTTPGTPGAGRMLCDFSAASVTLIPGNPYVTSVFQPGAVQWYSTVANYWTSGAGASGISNGLVNAPNVGGSANGQGCQAAGIWAFPSTSGGGTVYYVDVEVEAGSAPPTSTSGAFLASFI